MTTIDLGEVGSSPGDLPAAGRGPGRRPGLRRRIRGTGLALTAVLCVLTVTGSARPQQHGVRPLWSVPAGGNAGAVLTRDAAYLQRPDADNTRLTAYAVATGAVRWTRRLAGALGVVQVAESVGVVLSHTDPQVTVGPGAQRTTTTPERRETVALDAGTGAELWHAPGEPQSITGDTALIVEQTDTGVFRRVRLIRLRDNRTIWSRETPGVQSETLATAGDQPTQIITVGGAGDIKVYRYADGAYLNGARIPWATARPRDGIFNLVSANAGYLAVTRTWLNTFDTSVYRLDTLAKVWGVRDTNGYAFVCGEALCLSSGSVISSHDLATGRRRWQLEGSNTTWSTTIGDRLVLDDGNPELDGNPLLVDAATGHPIGERAQGNPVWDYPASDILLLRTTKSPPDRTSVTRWDLRTGHQRLLGSIGGVVGGYCQAAGRYLACQRSGTYDVMAVG